jgi:peptidoglycan/xylan/chitin deacetylase (PgdA/CDA1 family)
MQPNGRVAVLMYHSLDQRQCVLSTRPAAFAEHMRILHRQSRRVVSLEEVAARLADRSLLAEAVAITFDDGFRNVYQHALPILLQYRFQATVFLVTDYCGRTNSWPGQPSAISPRPLLRWSEIQEMSTAGISFGSHAVTHPDLRRLPSRVAAAEMLASKQRIEDAVGRPVVSFAYPYGAYDPAVKYLAAAHFRVACSTRLGFVRPWSDPFALERVDAFYLQHPVVFGHLFTRAVCVYLGARRGLRAYAREARLRPGLACT